MAIPRALFKANVTCVRLVMWWFTCNRIEPARKTESKETLDAFVKILEDIEKEIEENPKIVLDAPHTTPVFRIDEVQAARQPNLRFRPE